jgi:hypothetical protein
VGLLYQLEEEFEKTFQEQLQQRLQEALQSYRPTCNQCALVMHRHHTYARVLLTRHGELSLSIPVFRCATCGTMTSGMELLGAEEGRKRFSKNPAGSHQASRLGPQL